MSVMPQHVRRATTLIAVMGCLGLVVAGCGGSGSSPTHPSSGSRSSSHLSSGGFGAGVRRESSRLFLPSIIKGYEQGGATPAQARAVAACVIPILAKHGIHSILGLATSSDPSLPRTATAACKKKLGFG